MRLWDPGDNEEGDSDNLDLSELCCPKCGCNDVEIVRYPRGNAPKKGPDGKWDPKTRWFGGQGRGRCNNCQIEFSIVIEQETEEPIERIF